jgi:hypothetical protein
MSGNGETGKADHWAYWLPLVISLSALAVPALTLLLVGSIPEPGVTLSAVFVSARRGDFIVPAMVLCAAAVVQWWREVARSPVILNWLGGLITLANAVVVLGGLVTLAVAAVYSVQANSGLTADDARSVELVTWVCLATGGISGLATAALLSTGRGRVAR